MDTEKLPEPFDSIYSRRVWNPQLLIIVITTLGILALAFLSENIKTNNNTDLSAPSSSIELKDDTVIVVLGASGDLAKKKTVRQSPTAG